MKFSMKKKAPSETQGYQHTTFLLMVNRTSQQKLTGSLGKQMNQPEPSKKRDTLGDVYSDVLYCSFQYKL